MLVYTFVFSFIFRLQPSPGDPSGLDVFAVWLVCGLIPWTFFAGALTATTASLVENSALITKVYFPRMVLPTAAALTRAYNWGFEMLVVAVALIAIGSFLWPWIPVALLLMLLLVAFTVGVGLFLSIANVYFRDTEYLVTVVLQIWMYLTPIVYPVSLVQSQSDAVGGILGAPISIFDIYQVNPMYHFVSAFRNVLYDNRWPDPTHIYWCLGWTVAALIVGFLVFRANERRLAELL